MAKPNTLEVVVRLMDQFGANAEFIAADRADQALEAADAEAYDEWCLIAQTIAALTRHNPNTKTENIEPAKHRRPDAA